MPTFINDPSAMIWDATAVSNAFLCEFMPLAPEGYVKVYLYALMYAHGGAREDDAMLADIAKALEMTTDEVERALRYWERCRLVSRIQDTPPVYRFASVQQMMLLKQAMPQDGQYEEFARALNDVFGSRRQLHGGETVMAYEWVEQQKLPINVVIMLIRHMISTRGIHFSFREAQKLVNELCDRNVRTMEAAEAVFSHSEAAWKGARKVLTRLSIRRDPTLDEIEMFTKWTAEWGYAPKAVEVACSETTKAREPSFKYLDSVLSGIRERSGGKALTAAQVEKHLQGEQTINEKVRAMLAAFGSKASVVDESIRSLYRSMEEIAAEDVILLAAKEVGKQRGENHSIEKVIQMLEAWRERGLTTADDVNAYLKIVRSENKRLRALFALMGKDASCTQQNRELLRKWRTEWRVTDPLLDLAASYARNTDKPMLYMDKLLSGWREKDISTVAQAEEEHRQFTEKSAKAPAKSGEKRVIEQNYSQRDYDPAEVDGPSAEDLKEAREL